MTAIVYETIKRYAWKETLDGLLLTTVPVVVDEDQLEGSPLLANHEVRLCMADFVALRRLGDRDAAGLELEPA